MKQTIKKPYKTNILLYIFLLIIFTLFMIYGIYLQQNNFQPIVADVIKNLGFGCIASTLIAFIIEISNVRDKNRNFNNTYNFVYNDLRYSILKYLETWSEICVIINKKKDYAKEKMTWIDWYQLAKKTFTELEENLISEAEKFTIELLKYNLENVNKNIYNVISQKSLLEINGIYNDEMNRIIKDFEFEFACARKELDYRKSLEEFWHHFDSINKDIEQYINQWGDIKFYNNLKIIPYHVCSEKELIEAVIITNKNKSQN